MIVSIQGILLRTRKHVLTIKTTIYPAIIGFLWLFHNSALALSLHLDSFSNEQGLTQNSVTCSITDRRGFHWFATQGGLNRFDGYEFKRFKSHPTQPSLSSNWITDCVTTDNNLLWFSTATQGLNALNTETGIFTHFNRNSPLAIKDNRIWSMLTDQHNNLWLGHEDGNLTRLNVAEHETAYFTYSPNTQGSIIFQDMVIDAKQNLWLASNEGLIKFDTKTAKFSHFSASKKQLWRLKLTPQGQLLIASKTGLSVFDLESEQFNDIKQLDGIWISDILIDNNEHLWLSSYGQGLYYNPNYQTTLTSFSQFKHLPQQRHGLVNDYLLSLYQDLQGILWIGTDGYGLQRYDMRQNQFNHQQHSDDPNSISHDFIRALLKDSQGQLWVGTRNGLNRQTKDGFVRYHVDTSNLTNNNIFSLYEDSQQRIWIGTYGGGLLRYNRESDDFTSFTVQSHQLSSNNIYALTSDRNGNLWLGSNQGLSLFNPDNLTIEHFKHSEQHNSISNNTVFSLVYDNVANAIWAGTRVGLNKLTLNNNEFSHYQADQTNPNSLSHNMVTALHLQDDNTLWVGTFGGLNKLNKTTAEITRITEHDGLLNDNIFAIKQDAKGYLWLASNQGLTRYQPSSENMQHFLPRDGVQHNSFILGAAYQAQNGELFFGGINGFNQFDPLKLQLAATTPEPVLVELLINNQAIATAPYTKHETQAAKLISYIQTLSFNKGVGVIGFKFSALNSPSAPQQYQYGYKLAGFDKQFLYTNAQQRQINYPQLPAGDYQLQLKVKDQYGQSSNAKAMLDFTVVPPWWQSRLAYAGYVLLTGVIIWLIAASLYRAKLAEQTSKQARELNRLKSQFLDNISHELKTPLSLILAPLESLQLNHKDQASQKQLSMIKRNSLRLLTLINQLLQLSQRPSCAIHYVSPYPLAPFIKQLVADFTVLFEQKGIHVTMTDLSQGSCCIALEPEHATSIITNLVSNALKYTHSGGQVEISLSVHNNMAHIAIVDTGIGIEKHQQGIIFERFTRVAAQNQNGSGIGLALVKQLLEQYGGQISLTSEVGKGSCFTVSLPLTEAEHGATSLAASVNEATRPSNSQKLLIVEDNDEMRELLLTLFATEYHCLSAINGEQGLAICQTEMPDLVISDVMMPCMDGYQLLNALRTNNITSHIPVLLLSAKADTQSRLKGLDLLADDFLSKPFEPQLLLSRVQGLLSIRAVLNRHLAKQLAAHAPPLVLDPQLTQSKDYQFTERLKNIIRDNYHNEAFSIEEFAAGLYLSPRALQLKMKALYNLTPSDYIRNTRLEYAEKLLSDSDLSIGLIAEKVGFSSQSYFARCFKAKHNVSPKQFREKTNLNAKTSPV
ncbi:response regulator [Pseudoalteromonas sp. SG44-1]|nr:response regulator [Pseudoalteromonas sp. SG44-1]